MLISASTVLPNSPPLVRTQRLLDIPPQTHALFGGLFTVKCSSGGGGGESGKSTGTVGLYSQVIQWYPGISPYL